MPESKAAKPAKQEAKTEELVKIKLHKDRSNNADVFVSVNDYTAVIKRGVVVEVPWYVARVLERSMEQDEHAAELMEQLSRDDI